MKLLFLTPQIPYPPRQGTALRNWGLISHLARRHDIWLMSFTDTSVPAVWPAELMAACKHIAAFPVPKRSGVDRVKTLLTSNLPDMAWRLWSPDFAAQFQAWTSQQHFDIIQIEGIELARYAINYHHAPRSTLHALRSTLHAPRFATPALIFDDHNCEYLMQKRWFERDIKNPRRLHAALYSLAQWRKLATFERDAIRQARATLCCSAEDRVALNQLDPQFDPHIIFNGIDVAAYATDQQPATSRQQPATSRQPPTIVFTGKMDFRPNIDAMLWFGSAVWPRIQQAHPQAQWVIVGQKPSPRLNVLRVDPNITITGEVADPRPYIGQADVYIAPLRVGGGTRFKLMEAMAMHKPIVTTQLGCEGFNITSGREMMVADAPDEFADAVIALLNRPDQSQAMTERAFAFVSNQYDWSVIVPKLESIYERHVS